MTKANDKLIDEHYRKESLTLSSSRDAIMKDVTVRDRETDLISGYLNAEGFGKNVLDLGCGNGYTLNILSHSYPETRFFGIEINQELFNIAQDIKMPNCHTMLGDARALPYEECYFDIIYSVRCLINILSWDEQKKVLQEIYRTLKPNGYYLMIECFTDGLENNNRAREECGLEEINAAYHNRYLERHSFHRTIDGMFKMIESEYVKPNFLSSHYFISRVLHPLLFKDGFKRNSEFVQFFSCLPPQGNYSPIQAYLLERGD